MGKGTRMGVGMGAGMGDEHVNRSGEGEGVCSTDEWKKAFEM